MEPEVPVHRRTVPLVEFRKVKYQYLAVLCVNLISFSHGSTIGWTSPVAAKLQADGETSLDKPLTWNEISWIGSFTFVGALCGAVCYYLLLRFFSLRKALLMLPFPTMVAYIILLVAKNAVHLIIARVLAGFTGGGLFLCLPLYVAELSDRRCRGFLGSWIFIVMALGIFASFVVVTYLPYWAYPTIFIFFPIIFFCSVATLPKSPQHHLWNNHYQKAEESYIFYRLGNKFDSTKDKAKMTEDLLRLQYILRLRHQDTQTKSFKEKLCNRRSIRAIFVAVALVFLNVFTGSIVVVSYTELIFDKLSTSFDSRIAAIVVTAVQVGSVLVASRIVDRIGRRYLLIISCIGTALDAMALALFAVLDKSPTPFVFIFMPLLCMCIFLSMTNIGIVPISFVSMVEILPPEVREIGSMICIIGINLFAFAAIKMAPYVINSWGLDWLFGLFGLIAALGAVFVYFFVPETKLKNLYKA